MRFYFLGICGTAMGNVAVMMKAKGHEVFGADEAVYDPMATVLKNAGISIFEGYQEQRIDQIKPDMIIVGNVIARGNPEIEYLLETKKYPYCSLPELLKNEVLSQRKNIVVTGTHGKTTTTALTAYLLQELNMNPGYMIGGVPTCLPSGCQLGLSNSPFVIEGDEYDSAFFDKRSKFIHYNPHILIINNIEFDHADIFRDLEDIKRTFRHLIRLVPRNGYILANGDDENVRSLFPINWCKVLTVGFGKSNDLIISNYSEENESTLFNLSYKSHAFGQVQWNLTGTYNTRNAAMATLAISLLRDQPEEFNLSLLQNFTSVKRRQEVKYRNENCIIIEDFGHHPTAIDLTLQALRHRYQNYHITACFEPRSFTAAGDYHQAAFAKALSKADQVYIGAVHNKNKIKNPLNAHSLVQHLGQNAQAFDNNTFVLEALKNTHSLAEKKLVCFFTNGSFDGIIEQYINWVQTQSPSLIPID